MEYLFISDVHLGAFDDEKNRQIEKELIGLIDFCEEKNITPVLLGDIFDYWMEFSFIIPDIGTALISRFRKFNRDNKPVTYITGNHDNWTNGYFKNAGFDVEHEYRFLNIENKKILLLHGDGLSDKKFQLPRPAFHRLIRNNIFINFFQSVLSPKTALRVMKKFSSYSRKKDSSDVEKLNNWARELLNNSEIDYILSGHDHEPRMETFEGGCYLNGGAFSDNNSMIYYSKNDFSLVTWNAIKRTLQPLKETVKQNPVVLINE